MSSANSWESLTKDILIPPMLPAGPVRRIHAEHTSTKRVALYIRGGPLHVTILIINGWCGAISAQIEAKDSEFAATPLFRAVHGYGPNGPTGNSTTG